MGAQGGVVMDGRDIGTAVFPLAELKIFMTASDTVRAQRRLDELVAKGHSVTMNEVLTNLRERDRIDSTRTEDPLRQAPDALVLDNSNLSPAQQLSAAKAWALKAIEG
jgi:cytidylate kinase